MSATDAGARPDIIWILLDTVRPDRLRCCGAPDAPRRFIDDVLEGGTLFTRGVTAGPYTMIAQTALFTGFYGSTNGVNGAYRTSDDLADGVVTVTDILKFSGYSTTCFAGSPFEPMEPPHGFDSYTLAPSPGQAAVRAWQHAARPRFLSISLQSVHDATCAEPWAMTRARYDAALDTLSDELETLWPQLVGPDDVVMIYSDHGVRLRDAPQPPGTFRPEEEPTTGVYLTEHTVRCCCSLVGPGMFPRRRVDTRIRTIDLAPTMLDALGLPPLGAHGSSLWPWLRDGRPVPERVAYTETGGRWFSPWRPNTRAVIAGDWKLVQHDSLGYALHDLVNDPAERDNRVGTGHPAESTLRALLSDELLQIARPPGDWYRDAGVDHRALLALRQPVAQAPQLARLMVAYEAICYSLHRDSVAAVPAHAAELRRCAAAEHARAEPHLRESFALLVRLADACAAVTTLGDARDALAGISRLFDAFVRLHPEFWQSVVTYTADDGRVWIQKRNDDMVLRPYGVPPADTAPYA